LCIFTGWLFGLNRLKLYIAANISNPIFSPVLVFTEIQVGGWIRRGELYPISMKTLVETNLWSFALDLVLGSVIVGTVLGLAGFALTYMSVGRFGLDREEIELVHGTAQRYLIGGVLSWEFVNGKLRYDPVYREILKKGMLPETGTFLDLGCGRGLLLALLLESRKQYLNQKWPVGWPPPPHLGLIGMEHKQRTVEAARNALGGEATIELADLSEADLPSCHAAALLDVLHYLEREAQDALLGRLKRAVQPGGVLLIREVDADAGWGFVSVRIAERIRGLARGDWRHRVTYRSAREWVSHLEALGFETVVEDMGKGTPFANVLIRAQKECE
jgi:SAM-dependent methyltransferase